MSIHLLSDLHLEFAPFVPPRPEVDCVVLAGDIGTNVHLLENHTVEIGGFRIFGASLWTDFLLLD